MTKCITKPVALLTTAALVCGMCPAVAFAESGEVDKTQVVYVKASTTGNTEGVYVVNQFEASGDNPVSVSDYGEYETVKNLTDDQTLSLAAESSFEVTPGTPFLYQGDLSAATELPWTVSVAYQLDGQQVEPEALGGASGALEVSISIAPNAECAGNYADNYLLQVSADLDNSLASNIAAEDATEAQESGSTKLSYMLFPGKSATYTVTADVSDFEFDGWQLVGVPLSIALDIDDSEFSDATEKLDSLEQAISDINDGATNLSDATSELLSGTDSLGQGAANLESGAAQLSDATEALDSSTQQYAGLMQQFSAAGSDLTSGSSAYQEQLQQQASAYAAQASSISVESSQANYQAAVQTYMGTFAAAFAQAYAQAYEQTKDQKQAMAQAQQAAASASASQQAAMQSALTDLVTAQATKSSYESAAQALTGAASGYAQVGQGIANYVGSAVQLSQAAASISQGTSQINDAAGQVSAGASSLNSGASSLNAGALKLNDGAAQLASGTGEAVDETAGMSQEMIDQLRDKLQEYLNPDFVLADFANGSTTNIDNVQFVVKTDPIEQPDDETEEEVVEESQSLAQKFLALFKG